ncbi:MAG TPA: helix-turn-helix domain-containing protein [Reyranella sp.]|nr:helix-turn-helix domain-containing protein [Reyranella sp.]
MRRKKLSGAACPIARSLDVIGDWWSLLIVRDAMRGTRRFSDFQKGLGVSKNILTRRLRSLVESGVLEQLPAADSAYQEYRLSDKGRALYPVLVSLAQWGQDNAPTDGPQARLVDRAHGQPVPKLQVRASDGRVLQPGDSMMVRTARLKLREVASR